ncbi:MAG: hypothetical protein GWP08_14440 [Nitrospiraceae bacterium]|nr:hypothetical protein [Nitrospiraceae bacterium]
MFDRIKNALDNYTVILEPDENTPEWWAGAPSVVRGADGTFYLAARMREGNSPRGLRGYEIRILKSSDGRRFEPILSLRRKDCGLPGFERPALAVDPHSGRFKLYGCSPLEGGWSILKFDDAANPAEFDPASAKPVIQAEQFDDGFAHVEGYKDPVVFWDGTQWRMFVIGFDKLERIHQFVSADGEDWRPASGKTILENDGWHNFYTRPASVLPMAVGYLLVYEGSHCTWRDPVYNIATGLAYTVDLEHFVDLTPDAPLLRSTTPGDYNTWRYSHWMTVGDQVFVYFEACRPNNTNEIRLGVFDSALAQAAG